LLGKVIGITQFRIADRRITRRLLSWAGINFSRRAENVVQCVNECLPPGLVGKGASYLLLGKNPADATCCTGCEACPAHITETGPPAGKIGESAFLWHCSQSGSGGYSSVETAAPQIFPVFSVPHPP